MTQTTDTPKSSSFYWALKLLPAPKREAMFAIYAFCKVVDDIADGDDLAADKKTQLRAHRTAVEALYRGEDTNIPCVQRLKPVIADYALNLADVLAVIDGMEMDAVETLIIPDTQTFDLYIDRVACAVGRLSNRVFGLSGSAGDALAHELGNALQITNILRDIEEDAQRHRVYLPQDLLKAHGVSGDVAQVIHHANLEKALSVLTARAEQHFVRAHSLIRSMDKKASQPARLMHAVYAEVLARLKRRGLANIHISARLNKFQKLMVLLRVGLFG